MPETYIENILIRQDRRPETETPLLNNEDCDAEFEFEGVLVLKQIIKSVQNATHNTHDYVFQIKSVTRLEKQ